MDAWKRELRRDPNDRIDLVDGGGRGTWATILGFGLPKRDLVLVESGERPGSTST